MGTLKNQTALEWLYTQLNELSTRDEVADLIYKLEDEAKAMEKEQIMGAYWHGSFNWETQGSTKYYNETYGTDEN